MRHDRALEPCEFRTVEGRQVWESGAVIIAGIRHRVRSGAVVCEPTLNRQAWNVTRETGICRDCYPADENGQLELL